MQHKVKAFFNITENDSFEAGCQALMEITGLGKLRPNMILMGYKENWRTCNEEELQQYFNVIQLVTCFSIIICGLTHSLQITIYWTAWYSFMKKYCNSKMFFIVK